MTPTTEKKHYLRHFDLFDKSKRSPAFQGLRQSARTRFRELSFPTPKTEDWRFTSVAPLLKVPFEPAPETSVAAASLPPLLAPDSIRLVFVNGRHVPALSHGADAVAGSLGAAGGEQTRALQEVLGLADREGQVFTALNSSLLQDGAFVLVPDGKTAERVIDILYVSAPGKEPVVTHPRTVIALGKSSRATVVERYLGEQVYFTNAVCEIALGENAALDHYKVQSESTQAYHVAQTQVAQARASNFTTHFLSLGGGLVRNEVRVRFDGEGCEATVNGLYLAKGSQHVDNFTVIDHARPHCNSHELYKGILNDQGRGVFNGKIFVRPDAQKTDAKQTNKVLLLSDSATINTKPQLEIFADDVKCTHGATVGQLDAESIFYLRSRGIGADEARALLTYAFANDIVGRIRVEGLREWAEQVMRGTC